MKARYFLLAFSTLTWSASAFGADEEPICADRPSKSTGECTVPAGHWQIETGIADWTHDHDAGDLTVLGASLIKYGLSSRADIELGVFPLVLLLIAFTYGIIKVPTLVNSLFTGRSGDFVLP